VEGEPPEPPQEPPDEPEHSSPPLDDDEPPVLTREELAQRRARERLARKRAGQRRLLVLILAVVVLIVVIVTVTGGGGGPTLPRTTTFNGSAAAHLGKGPSYLSVATDTSVLPLNVLIADRDNNRLISISPKGQVVWTLAQNAPGDAYLSRTGRTAIISEHAESIVLMRRVDSGAIAYRYGHTRKPGFADNYLSDPMAAQETNSGDMVIADTGNCRILFIPPGRHHVPKLVLGRHGVCVHHVLSQPFTFARPDSAFPTSDGGLVVTEASPAWVDILSANYSLISNIELTGFTAPVDANEFGSGDLIVTDRTHPGRIEEFTSTGTVLWTYRSTTVQGELDRPSAAQVLPDGDVIVADSGNDRVVVIDPKTDQIVWQYGHTGMPGVAFGYLHTPSSVTLVPVGK